MAITLGIDTGGTYTDAVLIEDDATVLASAKSLTTRQDLAIGVGRAVEAVLASAKIAPEAVAMAALSTTLATNALVEGQGGRVALICAGFKDSDLDRQGLREALKGDPVLLAEGGHSHSGGEAKQLDREAVSASREKKVADFKTSQENNKKQAQALNMNAGNGDKIIQDIAGTYDMQFLDVARDYETDVIKLMGQEQEAYAAQQRRYNSIKPVVMPSRTGLLLNIGTIGAEGYQKYKTNLKPDTGEVVAP